MAQATQTHQPKTIPLNEEHAGLPAWLDAVFPWTASTMGHLGIALIFAFAIYIGMHQPVDDRVQIVIPVGFMDQSVLPVIAEEPGLGDPNLVTRQDLDPFANTHGFEQIASPDNAISRLQGSGEKDAAELIALGIGVSIGKGKDGVGLGEGGVLAPYGTPSRGGKGGIGIFVDPKVTNGSLKRVVYILDHSGSMLDSFDYLRQEAIRSVRALTPAHSFSVIMFSERESVIYPQLQRAQPDIKNDFATKLQNFRAAGMNDDLLEPSKKAFEAAFAMQPEMIYFLTDGRFDPRLIDIVTNTLNKNKKVRINTLAFVYNDPTSEDQLKELATKNGGVYKFVSEKDIGK